MKKIIFKKITFTDFKDSDFKKIIKKKKLFVFPSGPGLASIEESRKYYNSLQKADYVFFDSGFFVLLLKYFKRINVNKFSGYKFLNFFFKYLKNNRKKKIFCIDPNYKFSNSNKKYLKKIGVKKIYNYLAPKYNPNNLNDKKLLKKISNIKPNFIVINIGGGIQEILGIYLKNKIKFKTTIICTGGAISFFTGDRAPIGYFLDRIFLGWLVRILYDPKIYLKRYIDTFKFVKIFFKNKHEIKY